MKIELLTSDDIKTAMRLVEIAGWNQTYTDWQRIISYEPTGCFKAVLDDRLVGTVTTTSYESKIGWIGMMLVDPDYRRRGIGSVLMQSAIDYLKSINTDCIWLDATPMGQTVYERLGFQSLYSFHRWHLSCACFNKQIKSKFDRFTQINLHSYHQVLDRRLFGYDRFDYIERLRKDSTLIASQKGFGMIRQGRIANYLGPLVAENIDVAIDIASILLEVSETEVFLDYPGNSALFINWLLANKFSPVRTLTRMWLGNQTEKEMFQMQYAISDPATG